MKSAKYILAISLIAIAANQADACGHGGYTPQELRMFRVCTPETEAQWQKGWFYRQHERYENSALWQRITSTSIPIADIEALVYDSTLSDLQNLGEGPYADNKFAAWLVDSKHADDLRYLLIAKEIEQIRAEMNDPWYYAYPGDPEHIRLSDLLEKCEAYEETRHAARYALQIARIYFSNFEYQRCVDMWENHWTNLPQTIIKDMIASYVAGAYEHERHRDKAVDLYKQANDFKWLLANREWDDKIPDSKYDDYRVSTLEYIFGRYPDSPLLSVELQKYVRSRENYMNEFNLWVKEGCDDYDEWRLHPNKAGDKVLPDCDNSFYAELLDFAKHAAKTPACHEKAMWNYAIAYLYFLDRDNSNAMKYLSRAESTEGSPLIKDSVHAFRFYVEAMRATDTPAYRDKLLRELKWIDEHMSAELDPDKFKSNGNDVYFNDKNMYSYYFWQDVVRKVLLSELAPRMKEAGNPVLSLQLTNYANNRIHQFGPDYCVYVRNDDVLNEYGSPTYEHVFIPFDTFRKATDCSKWDYPLNYFDFSNDFFSELNTSDADVAAEYARRILHPKSELDRFLNERGYTDSDYICDIVGTLYLREMKYDKAFYWLSKISPTYQDRTNLAKSGYFTLNPFEYLYDSDAKIDDNSDYKLRFTQEMLRLQQLMSADVAPDRRAKAKIRYAIGLRNSFGRCWYLTDYSFDFQYTEDSDGKWTQHNSAKREGFNGNPYAQKAYARVDALMKEAMTEFTDRELAAKAQLAMKNFRTVIDLYPETAAATFVRGHCDRYTDYSLNRR